VKDENLSEIIQEALTTAFNTDGGTIITRWVMAVERYTADGKSLAFTCHQDMQPWEVIGMTEMASHLARLDVEGQVIDEMYTSDDDDDD
jgi:hypothetical protein